MTKYLKGRTLFPVPYNPFGDAFWDSFNQDMTWLGRTISDLFIPLAEMPTDEKGNILAAEPSKGDITKSIGGSTPAGPGKDPDRNWVSIKEKTLENELKLQGTNPQAVKKEHLGNEAKISRFEIKVDKNTGQLGIFEMSMGKFVCVTDYFLK